MQRLLSIFFFTLLPGISVIGSELPVAAGSTANPLLDACNVTWNEPGPTSSQSMPLGNGDIGLNVWVEPTGDVLFYIGKTDAWNESVHGTTGLLKLGRVRLTLSPSPLRAGAPFAQVLKLHTGEIQIQEGAASVRVWVDANHPVIRVEMKSRTPVATTVTLETWRTASAKDVILGGQTNRIAWYHRNGPEAEPHVANLTFGAVIKGDGLAGKDPTTLQAAAATSQLVSIYPLTATTPTPEQWRSQLDGQITTLDALDIDQTRRQHQQWWDQFWHRSWIFIQGGKNAKEVTQGYVLQRFITACNGRGHYPIKFNGALFNVDNPAHPEGKDKDGNVRPPKPVTADYRTWGGQYWFQNTRPMYWPRLAAGDFDLMLPLFKMYAEMLPANAAQVKEYYHHDGAYFAETAPFWGGLKYVGPEVKENWTDHYFTPILELSMMMLDYYEFTGDTAFARHTLMPVATAGLTFFDQHFKRDAQGKLLLDPDNAIEMYWKVRNPAPDIAGLRAILPRLIALPADLVSPPARQAWRRLLGELPPLPTLDKRGHTILLPYTGPQTAQRRNGENPELYAIYPFRLYGLDKPGMAMALATFDVRKCPQQGCWSQDPIQAAMLGLSEVAREAVAYAFQLRSPELKFPAFWAPTHDYQPDQDNGGNGEHGLQQMLMQTDGRKILLLPAWPEGWDGEFKLNAPYQTSVQGKIIGGKLCNLVVTPAARGTDVIDMSRRPAAVAEPKSFVANGSVTSLLSARDPIVALKQTRAGAANLLAEGADCGTPAAVLDGNPSSKHYNRAKDGINPAGINTGVVITPLAASQPVTALQFATGNDMPRRDPYSITLEGSNAPDAAQAGGNGFVLIYQGPAGLDADPGRNSWGNVVRFRNPTAYQTYRLLVTDTHNDADGTQYAELKLGQ